jgi:hypothetical protein
MWHPGLTDDAELVIRYIHETYSSATKIFLIGFSAGSNICNLLISKIYPLVNISGVFCCCVCWDYKEARRVLEVEGGLIGKMYSRLLVEQLKVYLIPTKVAVFYSIY